MTKVCIVCREDVLTNTNHPDMPLIYTMYQPTDVLVSVDRAPIHTYPRAPIRYVCEICRHNYMGDWLTLGQPKLGEKSMCRVEAERHD